METYIPIFYRSIFIFVLLFILTRITGKKHMSELTFYDYISGITIGAIAGASCVDSNIRIIDSIIALAVWTLIPIIISLINIKSLKFKRFMGGKPVILIKNGAVIDTNMKQVRYNIEDLLAQLRKKDIFNLSEVEFAVLEINGELNVLKKSPFLPVTPKDLNISLPYKGLAIDLIINGNIIESSLEFIEKDKSWLIHQLNSRNADNYKHITYAGLTSDGTFQLITDNNPPNS